MEIQLRSLLIPKMLLGGAKSGGIECCDVAESNQNSASQQLERPRNKNSARPRNKITK